MNEILELLERIQYDLSQRDVDETGIGELWVELWYLTNQRVITEDAQCKSDETNKQSLPTF